MRVPGGRALAILTLALWVVSGPIGMAFDGCAMMGTMCEAPCGISSYILGPTVTPLTGLQALSYAPWASPLSATLVSAGPPTPPPRLTLLSA